MPRFSGSRLILGPELFGRKTPERGQDGPLIPVGDFRLGTRLTDAMNCRQQQVMSCRWSGFRWLPHRFQDIPYTGTLSRHPECSRKSEFPSGGFDRNGGGAIFQQLRHALGGAQIGLFDDARLTVDAGTHGNVVVKLVSLLLRDDRRHIG